MALAKQGDTVMVNYKGSLNDGTVFADTEQKGPLEFTIGEGQIMSAFEDAVIGMEKGESKTTVVPAVQAFGSYSEELLMDVGRDQFPENIVPEVGNVLTLGRSDGSTMDVIVARVDEESVTLDANHPLAGQDLILDIELVEVVEQAL